MREITAKRSSSKSCASIGQTCSTAGQAQSLQKTRSSAQQRSTCHVPATMTGALTQNEQGQQQERGAEEAAVEAIHRSAILMLRAHDHGCEMSHLPGHCNRWSAHRESTSRQIDKVVAGKNTMGSSRRMEGKKRSSCQGPTGTCISAQAALQAFSIIKSRCTFG